MGALSLRRTPQRGSDCLHVRNPFLPLQPRVLMKELLLGQGSHLFATHGMFTFYSQKVFLQKPVWGTAGVSTNVLHVYEFRVTSAQKCHMCGSGTSSYME